MASNGIFYATACFLFILVCVSIYLVWRFRNEYIRCETEESALCPTYNCDSGRGSKSDHRAYRGADKTPQSNDRYINIGQK